MAKLLDPVCGMTVDDTALRAPGYDDVAFCAPGCRTTFLTDPDAYPQRLDGAEPMAKKCTCGASSDGICTCGHEHGHGHDHDHGHHDSHDHEEPATVAAGSGCCGGHGH